MERNADDETDRMTPRTVLARQLRRSRELSGLSVRKLADKVGYPFGYISRVENEKQLPSDELATAFDTFFETGELFAELLAMAQDTLIAPHYRNVLNSEPDSERIQVFSSSLIPGLLQTPDYTRAIFRAGMLGVLGKNLDELVAARMRRKRIFEVDDPPLYWAIMDETALKRPVGGQECMRAQLQYVVEFAQRSHVTVQVLPFSAGEYPVMGGFMTLVALKNGKTIGAVENFTTGKPVESPKRIIRLTQLFDVARSMALTKGESLDLIRSYLREYET